MRRTVLVRLRRLLCDGADAAGRACARPGALRSAGAVLRAMSTKHACEAALLFAPLCVAAVNDDDDASRMAAHATFGTMLPILLLCAPDDVRLASPAPTSALVDTSA